jgi:thiol-disulfide isomerase/thioredoxin
MSRRRSAVALAVLGLGVPAVAGCSGGSADARGVKYGETVLTWDRGKGPVFPVLEGTDLAGKPLSTASARGKVLVVNVWGSWCGPCREETPALKAASDTLMPRGVRFVGLDIQERGDRVGARAYERQAGIRYPSFDDDSGALLLQLRGIAVTAPPQTLVVGPDGHVTARYVAPITANTLADLVSDAGGP